MPREEQPVRGGLEDHQHPADHPDLRAPVVTEAAYSAAIPPKVVAQVTLRLEAPEVLAAVVEPPGRREPLAR